VGVFPLTNLDFIYAKGKSAAKDFKDPIVAILILRAGEPYEI
jgi:hypothetical protein